MRDRAEAGRLEYKEKIKTWEEWIEDVKKRKGLTKMEDIYIIILLKLQVGQDPV